MANSATYETLQFKRINHDKNLVNKDRQRFAITCAYHSGLGLMSAKLNPLFYEAAIAARCCINGDGFDLRGQLAPPPDLVPKIISTH